jgi:hypothetical protein
MGVNIDMIFLLKCHLCVSLCFSCKIMCFSFKLAFIDEAIHPKSAFINEALCAENEIKHELKTIAIT